MNVEKIVKLADDEEVLTIARNHWVTRVGALSLAFLLVALPFFLMVPLISAGKVGLAVFAVMVVVGVFLGARTSFLMYWNAFVVTSRRVIDIDQRGFFSRTVSEAPFERIQDVTYSVKGLFAALMGYGTLTLQTAGTAANLELPHAMDPKVLHHIITSAMAEQRSRRPAEEGGRSGKVTQLLEAASELNDAEARAFLVAIQKAVAPKETHPPEENDLAWLAPDGSDEPPAGRG
jgi:uncharacterized membrane protein YdbT with pleckstrin-like domain